MRRQMAPRFLSRSSGGSTAFRRIGLILSLEAEGDKFDLAMIGYPTVAIQPRLTRRYPCPLARSWHRIAAVAPPLVCAMVGTIVIGGHMADHLRVALEIGPKGKKVAAVAPDWPGLQRGAK